MQGEDAVLWPLLWERGAEQAAAIVPSMEEQHHGIEAALYDVNALVPTWQSTARRRCRSRSRRRGPVPFSARGAPPLTGRRALRQTRPENPKTTDEFLEER